MLGVELPISNISYHLRDGNFKGSHFETVWSAQKFQVKTVLWSDPCCSKWLPWLDCLKLKFLSTFQAEFSTAGGEATFARFFQLDEAMDEFSSRRNSVNSAAAAFNGGAVEDGIRVREAMETHAGLLLRVSKRRVTLVGVKLTICASLHLDAYPLVHTVHDIYLVNASWVNSILPVRGQGDARRWQISQFHCQQKVWRDGTPCTMEVNTVAVAVFIIDPISRQTLRLGSGYMQRYPDYVLLCAARIE